jgi:hypothetical protein
MQPVLYWGLQWEHIFKSFYKNKATNMPDCQQYLVFYATCHKLVNVSDEGMPSWGKIEAS